MTIVEAMTAATAAINNAVAKVLGVYDLMVQLKAATVLDVRAVVDGFVNRPPLTKIDVDEVNGSEAADGSTIEKARRSLDAVIGGIGRNPTQVLLLSNATIRKRLTVNAGLVMNGIQPAANPNGFIEYVRTISFLGGAESSPIFSVGTTCSGIFFNGPTLRLNAINFALPDVPAQDYRSHLTALSALAVSFFNVTVTVASPAAGALFGVQTARLTATGAVALGSGAPGHLFDGVAAGANPNAQYPYTTNITSA